MKKILTILSSLVFAFTMVGCASDTSPSQDASTTDHDGNVLVVYFSATGNTEEVANEIADHTQGDIFEIEPADPYTEEDLNWNDENSRVVQEHENEELQEVELVLTQVENWEDYDTIFLGYPIWWGEAAWPVKPFVQANDFTNKTVIPFCTSSSSGLGNSAQNLASLASGGEWQEGQRFSSHPDAEEIDSWIDSLDY